MNEQLVEEGWLAPADPGPTRLHAAVLASAAIILLAAWALACVDVRHDDTVFRAVDVELDDTGAISIDGDAVDVRQHVRSGVVFLVGRATVAAGRPLRIRLDLPPGVIDDQVAVRVLDPQAGDPGEVLVTVRRDALERPPAVDPEAGSLRVLTESVDARIRAQREDQRRLADLRSLAPVLMLAALVGSVAVPLLAWRHARRRWMSMRRPGPGTQLGVEPPSSLDPIGAAILVAGARPVDAGAAFAGQVLDLVERRQLPMRRSGDTPPGVGTLVGMHHAEEVTDVVVPLLETMLAPGQTSVLLPDDPAKVRRVDAAARAAWEAHIEGRSRFEGAVVRAPARRIQALAAAAALVSVAAAIGASASGLDGRRALLWLVAVAALLLAASLGAWAFDARRWRTVARSRRTERAQWLAWRERAVDLDGPAADLRNLPLLVAVDAPLTHVRGGASASAVDLDAATVPAIRGLRRACDDA